MHPNVIMIRYRWNTNLDSRQTSSEENKKQLCFEVEVSGEG